MQSQPENNSYPEPRPEPPLRSPWTPPADGIWRLSNDDLLFRDYGKPPDPLRPRWTRRFLLLASIVVVVVVVVVVLLKLF